MTDKQMMVKGLELLTQGFALVASATHDLGEIAWYETQLRNYTYLLKNAKRELEKELLNDDFNAS